MCLTLTFHKTQEVVWIWSLCTERGKGVYRQILIRYLRWKIAFGGGFFQTTLTEGHFLDISLLRTENKDQLGKCQPGKILKSSRYALLNKVAVTLWSLPSDPGLYFHDVKTILWICTTFKPNIISVFHILGGCPIPVHPQE